MKKLILVLGLTLLFNLTWGQLININPDPNGPEWLIGGIPLITPEIQSELDQIPQLTLSIPSEATDLPESKDNSTEIYMRDVFHQEDGSCGQASGIGYTYTYEINRLRNVSSSIPSNQYPTHFAHNIVRNYGDGPPGAYYYDGWELIKNAGCPTVEEYGGMFPPGFPAPFLIWWRSRTWESDYNLYKSALTNRVDDYYSIDATTPDGLNILKHWLNDHNEGNNSVGGLACFVLSMGVGTNVVEMENGDDYIFATLSDSPPGHAMTIVGYDDNIGFDFNEDGYITDYIDLNGDNIIDMRDWEWGAVKVVNSWLNWGDSSYAYLSYKFFAEVFDGGATKNIHEIQVVNVSEGSSEPLILKAKVSYDYRENLLFQTGYANKANDNSPYEDTTIGIFKKHGGSFPMQARHENDNEPLEAVFDFGQFYLDNDFGKIYFIITEEAQNSGGNGTIESFSIVDYRWGEEFELECKASFPVDIENNSDTRLYVNYDLIPHEEPVSGNELLITSDKVCRFNPIVSNNNTLRLSYYSTIDMYNSTLTIEEGSTLNIRHDATIHAKAGNCKIIIDGNIDIEEGLSFIADEGCTIELEINNTDIQPEFNNCTFTNCFVSINNTLASFNNCTFTNSFIMHSGGSFVFNDNDLSNSSISARNTDGGGGINFFCSISNNEFNQGYDNSQSIIDVNGYFDYSIQNNTITNIINTMGSFNGISITNAGGTRINTHIIDNNTVSGTVCGQGSCPSVPIGISIYSSTAKLNNNYVHGNYIGLEIFHESIVEIVGNPDAEYVNETQRFINNQHNQVYASSKSFPVVFEWNAVFNSLNNCFVFHDRLGNPSNVNVANNYWGTNFDPLINLCPSGYYDYLPIWYLTNIVPSDPTDAELLYSTAQQSAADSSFIQAKSEFTQVVTDYPTTNVASASLKEIYYLEPLSDNDFSTLKNWYLTCPEILADTVLDNEAEGLANKCDIKLNNNAEAIAWYESVIANPESIEDSVFAIIDLEYLYLSMGIDTSLRSVGSLGKYLQYIPESFEQYKNDKNRLLSLLSGANNGSQQNDTWEDNLSEESVNGINVISNYPNPFNNSTTFNFQITNPNNYDLSVYSQTGKLIKKIEWGYLVKGNHSKNVNMYDFSSGIYFYSLQQNRITIATNKMIVL